MGLAQITSARRYQPSAWRARVMRQGIPIRSSGLSAGCCKLSGLDLEGSRMRLPSTSCIRSPAATVQTRQRAILATVYIAGCYVIRRARNRLAVLRHAPRRTSGNSGRIYVSRCSARVAYLESGSQPRRSTRTRGAGSLNDGLYLKTVRLAVDHSAAIQPRCSVSPRGAPDNFNHSRYRLSCAR